ncbi:hypothetical protein Taro_044664 [Colocasia esculenta]|uniref:Aminotransferase-like plant mobile domain-containing protein n=1 Tax=Colocasia esculenta TaxID=4460 RepID=A0A843WYR4_COLES|nr:hypothetical protein [Colocasia esculenta]
MEGGGDSGAGSSQRKRQAERRSSRQRAEVPPAEETVPEIEMEEEEEVPAVDVETTRKAREDAMKTGEMRARVSWLLVLEVYLALPTFQRDRLEDMGFGEVLRMDRIRADPVLTQALCSRWDVEATTFIFPWGHMIPSLKDVSQITGFWVYGRPVSGFTYPGYVELAHRLLGLTVEARSSLVPRVALQESLGLYDVGKQVGETVDEQLQRLIRGCRAVLAEEPGAEADLDLHRFLILFLGRLLFATRGDAVHCRFLPLLEDLDEVWTYLHLSALRRGILARPSLVPIACHWDPRRDMRTLSDQLASLQEAIDCYPQLDVVWQPYLEEGDEGQPWLVQARPYFGRSVWVHALNLVLPLHLHLCQQSLGLRQSAVEFPSRDWTPRPGRSFRGLHDTTYWRERAKEQIQNWECRGKGVKSNATTDRRELERVRRAAAAGASSSRAAGSSQSDLEDPLAAAVRRAEETHADLAERETALRATTDRATELQGQVDSVAGERGQLRIRAEAAEARVIEVTRELATLWVQGSSADQEELV